jgi:hypothetical protein
MPRHPSFANNGTKLCLPKKQGGGAPESAFPTGAAPHSRTLPSESASGAARATPSDVAIRRCFRARSPFGAPSRLSSQGERWRLGPGRASRDEVRRRYLRLWTAFKPSTWRAGHHAGGDDARTARVRSVWLRPREPPSLPFGEYPRPKSPLASEAGTFVAYTETKSRKKCTTMPLAPRCARSGASHLFAPPACNAATLEASRKKPRAPVLARRIRDQRHRIESYPQSGRTMS